MAQYFADIEIGSSYTSAGRTITETDIVNFAGLSGDFNPLHMDEEWARDNAPFGTRIAHGLLVQSIGEGLAVAGVGDWQILAFLEVQRKMIAPVLPGDRIQQKYQIIEKRPSSKDPNRGIVTVEITIENQRGEVVQSGRNIYLIGGNA